MSWSIATVDPVPLLLGKVISSHRCINKEEKRVLTMMSLHLSLAPSHWLRMAATCCQPTTNTTTRIGAINRQGQFWPPKEDDDVAPSGPPTPSSSTWSSDPRPTVNSSDHHQSRYWPPREPRCQQAAVNYPTSRRPPQATEPVLLLLRLSLCHATPAADVNGRRAPPTVHDVSSSTMVGATSEDKATAAAQQKRTQGRRRTSTVTYWV